MTKRFLWIFSFFGFFYAIENIRCNERHTKIKTAREDNSIRYEKTILLPFQHLFSLSDVLIDMTTSGF